MGAAPYFAPSLQTVSLAKVKRVGSYAFYASAMLSLVDLPQVASLGSNGFAYSPQLVAVNAPELKSIEISAFYACASLMAANYPHLAIIPANAFARCGSLATANFAGATSIAKDAFKDCGLLASLVLPAAPPSALVSTFTNCPEERNLVLVDRMQNQLTGEALEQAAHAYKSVDDGSVDDGKWYGWKLGSTPFHKITIAPTEGGLVFAPGYAMEGQGVTVIYRPDFGGMLETATYATEDGASYEIEGGEFLMPEGSVTIHVVFKTNALRVKVNGEADARVGVSLADALRECGGMLSELKQLEVVGGIFTSADWQWLKANRSSFVELTDFTLTEDVSSVADIPNSPSKDESHFPAKIERVSVAKIESIGNYAFAYCGNLREVDFPQVKVIGKETFRDCYALLEVTFPQVNEIGRDAFTYCTGLQAATFLKVEILQFGSFRFCPNLQHAKFPVVKEFGEQAFRRCTSLTTLTLGATPPKMNDDVFEERTAEGRHLALVEADGDTHLVDQALSDAKAAYKAAPDGNTRDALWFGFDLDIEIYTITINKKGAEEGGKVKFCPSIYLYGGEEIEITEEVDEGYEFVPESLKVYERDNPNNEEPIDNNSYSFIMPGFDVTVTARFAKLYSVTLSGDNTHGSFTATPRSDLMEGDRVELKAEPENGYILSKAVASSVENPDEEVEIADMAFTMPASNVEVHYEFAPLYTVTVRDDIPNGKLFAYPNGEIAAGTEVILSPTPNADYVVVPGSLKAYNPNDDSPVIITDGKFIMPTHDVFVTCRFDQIIYSQVTIAEEVQNGIITTSHSDNVAQGTLVVFDISTHDGYRVGGKPVVYQTGNRSVLVPLSSDNSFIMPAFDVTINCDFEKRVYHHVTVDPDVTNGKLVPIYKDRSVLPDETIEDGEIVYVTTITKPNYALKEGSLKYSKLDGTMAQMIENGSFVMPGFDVILTCEFELVRNHVFIADGIKNGTIIATPYESIPYGSIVEFTIYPEEGYTLKKGTLRAYNAGNPSEVVSVKLADNTFVMPPFDVVFTAEFERSKSTPVESVLLREAGVKTSPFASALELSGLENAVRLEVYSSLGQRIYSQPLAGAPTLRVESTSWQAGLYLVRQVDNAGESKVLRVVKR